MRITWSLVYAVGLFAATALVFVAFSPADEAGGPEPPAKRASDPPLPAAKPAPAVRPAPRNLILISLDTLRADHLGCYGYRRGTSPNLDAFAARSVRFSDCLSASGHTLSSHKSLLSGRDPSAFLEQFASRSASKDSQAPNISAYEQAFRGWPSPGLARRLKTERFSTRAYTDGGFVDARYGFGEGFDEFRAARIGLAGHRAEAEPRLRAAGNDRLFVFLHCYDVHCPYDPPASYLKAFEQACAGPLSFKGKCGKTYFNALDLSTDDKAHIARHYDAGILHVDHEFGQLIATLRASGRLEDTMIVVTSDHGESLGERKFVGHGELYQNQLQVPLMIYLPGVAPGVVDAPVAGIDLLPTILDVLLDKRPEGLDGRSLKGLILGAANGKAAGIAKEFRARQRFASVTVDEGGVDLTQLRKAAVVDAAGLKLIYDPSSGQGELYDLTADPSESRKISGTRPADEARLKKVLEARESASLKKIGSVVPALKEEGLTEEQREQLRSLGYID